MNRFLLIYICSVLLGLTSAIAQDSAQVVNVDKRLSQADFFELIKAYHPVVRQAGLLSDQAMAQLRTARGGFDPKLYSDINQKRFKDDEYWHLSEYGLKVPTWFGIEAKASYEWNSGIYQNPERNVPNEGLGSIGISMPLGQGLFIDERRAALKQAKIFREMAEGQQLQVLNDLLLDAAKAYWEWSQAYERTVLLENALDLATLRYEGVVESYVQGDKPAIDTLESYILVQDREVNLLEAQVVLQNTQLIVSNFLWFENDLPLELEEGVEPDRLTELPYQTDLPSALADSVIEMQVNTHPILMQYNFKLQQLDVERRMKIEKLKPKLNVNYNLLTTGAEIPNGDVFPDPYYNQNYKFGISASIPLLFREGRGSLGQTKIKIEQTNLKIDLKRLELINKVRSYQNELMGLNQQIVIYEDAVANYQLMLDGENAKFQNGESSIFLINSREVKLLDAQNKLVALKTKYRKALAGLSWALGQLPVVN